MSLTQPPSQDRNPGITKSVSAALREKYEDVFAFYRVRAVNEMVNGRGRRDHIELGDVRILAEETEFLRRVYYYRTGTGREEITTRIRLCTEYYSTQPRLSFEYPTMIVTDHQTLFMRRHKQLKRLQAGEVSSEGDEGDEHEEERNFCFEPADQDMLDELQNSSLENEDEEVDNCEDELVYEEEEGHDVFGGGEDSGKEGEGKMRLRDVEEVDVRHLVLDVAELEAATNTSNLRLPSQSITLRDVQNNLPPKAYTPVSITPITHISLIEREFKSFQQLFLSNSLDSSSVPWVNYSRLCEKVEKAVSLKPVWESTTFESVREEEEMDTRRRSIREKAEELLRRVRKEHNHVSSC